MLTLEAAGALPVAEQLERLTAGPRDVGGAIAGHGEAVLGRRPDGATWAPTEVICHLRDTEEGFLERFRAIMAMDEPRLAGPEPDRWADERQYLRSDPFQALAAFGARRADTLAFLGGLAPDGWRRAGIHPRRGRMTLADLVALMVWHDANHLHQIVRGLRGDP